MSLNIIKTGTSRQHSAEDLVNVGGSEVLIGIYVGTEYIDDVYQTLGAVK